MPADRFTYLTGVVRTEGGYVTLNRGDEIPDGILDEERKRLESLGAIGDPDALEAARVAAEFATASDEQLAAYVDGASVQDVVDRAGSDRALAERLLAAEKARPKPRKGVVEGLEALVSDEG